jgi:hypothetical protein
VPINAIFNNNNAVRKVQKVDQFQNLMPIGHDEQSVLSPVIKAGGDRATFDSAKDKSCLPSRAKPPRKDKAAAAVQSYGKPRRQAVVRSPVQPDSFMASARGASRAGGPQDENGPKKRSRTEIADEGDQGKVVLQAGSVFNNPVFEKNETAGPGSQPAETNEYCSMELPRLGKPACNS